VGVRAWVDAPADLRDPQLDVVVSEHGKGEAELAAVEGAGRLADDHRLEATIRPSESTEQACRFGAPLPRQGPALADVEVLGDDYAIGREDRSGPAHLPLLRARRVLLVLGADTAVERESGGHGFSFAAASRISIARLLSAPAALRSWVPVRYALSTA
jgi:hypothetical protein